MLKRIEEPLSNFIKFEVVNEEINKMTPYIDPQVFKTGKYSLNEKSNVYSIGLLLWEISSGRRPFCNGRYDFWLDKKILQGLRENIIPDTPQEYIKIYKGK